MEQKGFGYEDFIFEKVDRFLKEKSKRSFRITQLKDETHLSHGPVLRELRRREEIKEVEASLIRKDGYVPMICGNGRIGMD